MVRSRLDSIRAAVEQGAALAGEFHTALANFYDSGVTTPVFANVPVRFKKPRPSAFDAGNQTEWATKRNLTIKAPMDLSSYGSETIIRSGLVVQLAPADAQNADGDPSLYAINFVVQSALTSQFAAEREIVVTTEVNVTPRVS